LLFVSVPSPPWICEQSDYFGRAIFSSVLQMDYRRGYPLTLYNMSSVSIS
jgi:hypothetical protein